MSENVCISCRRRKAVLDCEICQADLCKDCVNYLEAGTFSFLKKVPEELTHTRYCQNCHGDKVEPALESYQEIMGRAKGLYFFFNTQKRQLPIMKRSKESVRVEACEDRNETILRLAFLAAEQGYNCIIEAEVTSEKVRNEGYQKSRWQGIGVPAQVDSEKLERRSE